MSEEMKSGTYRVLNTDCIMPLNYYNYGQAFFGSGNGQRFRICIGKRELPLPDDAKEGDKPPVEKYLTLELWPEPYAYDATDKDGIVLTEYPFNEESYEKLLAELDTKLAAGL